MGIQSLQHARYCTSAIMPQKDSELRKTVRSEIKLQKELEKLEEKYNAGEISKFEYEVNKAALVLVHSYEQNPNVCYSTTA